MNGRRKCCPLHSRYPLPYFTTEIWTRYTVVSYLYHLSLHSVCYISSLTYESYSNRKSNEYRRLPYPRYSIILAGPVASGLRLVLHSSHHYGHSHDSNGLSRHFPDRSETASRTGRLIYRTLAITILESSRTVLTFCLFATIYKLLFASGTHGEYRQYCFNAFHIYGWCYPSINASL